MTAFDPSSTVTTTPAALEPTVRQHIIGGGGVVHHGYVTAVFDDLLLHMPIRHWTPVDVPLFQRRTVTEDRAVIELVDEAGRVLAMSSQQAWPKVVDADPGPEATDDHLVDWDDYREDDEL